MSRPWRAYFLTTVHVGNIWQKSGRPCRRPGLGAAWYRRPFDTGLRWPQYSRPCHLRGGRRERDRRPRSDLDAFDVVRGRTP